MTNAEALSSVNFTHFHHLLVKFKTHGIGANLKKGCHVSFSFKKRELVGFENHKTFTRRLQINIKSFPFTDIWC